MTMFGYKDEDEGDEKTDLSIIKGLMQQLIGEMSPSKDDFEERLGRKKPDLMAIKVEGAALPEDESMDDGDKDKEMVAMGDEENPEMDMLMGEKPSPEMDLKKRLMKLRA